MSGDYYTRLGVSRDATTDEIVSAYREKLVETHPDVSDDSDASERTKTLIRAKEVLTDETERSRYDRLGHDRYLARESGDGLNMTYHYGHTLLDYGEDGWWDIVDWEVEEMREVLTKWVQQLEVTDAWNTVYLGTHDTPRIVSRFGNDDRYHYESATMLATLLLTFPATPFVYQGDELGMTNYPWSSREEMRDADATNRVRLALEEGRAEDFADVQDVVRYRSRDNARTPMQWSDREQAGFTDGEPWIPVNPAHEEINAADQRGREDSILAYYRDLIDLRHDEETLVYGVYDLLAEDHPRVWAYERTLEEDTILVALNWAGRTSRVALGDADTVRSVLACNYDDPGTDLGSLALRPYEARVYRVN